jgi:hypothetical protein
MSIDMTHPRHTDTNTPRPNPLARAAAAIPTGVGWMLSNAGRAFAIALAILVAVDQSYTRTRTFAVVVAVVVAITLIPLAGRWFSRLMWLGAGMTFFGGALLAHLTTGKLMLLAGVLAATGAAIADQHAHRPTGVAWFFTGSGLVAALIAAIVLGIEG